MSLTSDSTTPTTHNESSTAASKPASAAAKALAKRRGKKPAATSIEASVAREDPYATVSPEGYAPDPIESGAVTVHVSTPETTHEVIVTTEPTAPIIEAPAAEAKPTVSAKASPRTQWYDLAASPIKGTVKPGSVLFHTIALLRHSPASIAAIQAMLDSCSGLKQKHSAIKLMRWASNNRGYGFRLDLTTNLIHLVETV